MQTLNKEALFTTPYLAWKNRAYPTEEGVRVDLTLSGFTVMAGRLTLSYRVSEPLYTALVMGEDYRKIYLEGEGEITLFEGEEPTLLSFVKLTEQQHGTLEILSLTGDFYPLPTERRPLITFYGDSLTCGYGVEGNPGDAFQKETENPLLGFAYTLCKKRGADYEMFSYSGISVSEKIWVPEYTLGEICFGYSMYNRAPYPYERKSDLVVVNIGTNDGCAIDNGLGTGEGLTQGLLAFCREVVRVHAGVPVVICSGFMDRLPAQKEAADSVYETLKGEGIPVYRFIFPRNVLGANGHPNWKAQVEGGCLLAAFLENELKK